MANLTVEGLKPYYLTKYQNMVITRPGPVESAANLVIQGRKRYEEISKATGIPWFFIGICHLRESSCNFRTHLHNGDPLSGRTYHVPAGRPLRGSPPFTFEESAIDALTYQGLTRIKKWPLEQIAFSFEAYNGWGYRYKGIPSAYLWSGSNQYTSGKYVADGVFSSTAVDVQLGTMCVMKRVLDLTGEKIQDVETTTVPNTGVKPIPAPNSPSAVPPTPANKEMNAVSKKFFLTAWIKRITQFIGGGVVTVKGLDVSQIQATKGFIDSVKEFATAYGLYVALFAVVAIILYCTVLQDWMKEDVVEGRSSPSSSVNPALAPDSTAEPVPVLLSGNVLIPEEAAQ